MRAFRDVIVVFLSILNLGLGFQSEIQVQDLEFSSMFLQWNKSESI